LSVVCKSCGSEVSPYVTECPYCGTRLRKRAPKLERQGDAIAPKQRRRRRRAPAMPRLRIEGRRSYATIAAILGPAVVILVQRATDRPLTDFGAILGPVGSDWWRYLAAPFAYNDIGYLFVVAVAIAVFGSALERRLGTVPVLLLILASGALGMLAADGIYPLVNGDGHILFAAGGNGIALAMIAAWFPIRRAESRGFSDDYVDVVGVLVFAAVMLLLPAVEDSASFIAGVAGGAVGLAAGLAAATSGRTTGL
jgi:membrane associated rhomboid family serine protease